MIQIIIRPYTGLSMLDKIGLSNIWAQQFEIDIPLFDMYKQSLYSSVHN